MGDPWYDSYEGLKRVKSLAQLHKVLKARALAGDKDKLNRWYLAGRYWLDSFGQLFFIKQDLRLVEPNFPHLASEEVFKRLLDNIPGKYDFSYLAGLPNEKSKCPICGHGWILKNAFEAVRVDDDTKHVVDLDRSGWKGKKIGRFFEFLRNEHPAKFFSNYAVNIYLDIPFTPETAWDWQDENSLLPEKAFAVYTLGTYYHKECHEVSTKLLWIDIVRDVLGRAGLQDSSSYKLHLLKDGYSADRCVPWFLVTNKQINFVIGHRKHVWQICWGGSFEDENGEIQYLVPSTKLSAKIAALFSNEDVTKGETFVHAHGHDKAAEYLKAILKAVA